VLGSSHFLPDSQYKPEKKYSASMKPRLAKPLQIIALCLASTHLVNADSATWNGTTDGAWATVTNWSSNPNPVPGPGNTATFDNTGNANTLIDLGVGVSVGSILFDTNSVASYTLGAAGAGTRFLTLDAGGTITVNSGISADQTVNANLLVGPDASAHTVNNSNTDNSITFAGNVSGASGNLFWRLQVTKP
jgi:hypothetical protein